MTGGDDPALVVGTVAPRLEGIAADLQRAATLEPGWRFRLCIRLGGELALDAWRGDELATGLVPLASVSKGVAGLVVAALIDGGELDPERSVSYYWPEFASAGKSRMSVAEVLSHRAGLLRFPRGFDWDRMIGPDAATALAATTPGWSAGTGHGYHAFTIGTLVDELVRRITGSSTAELLPDLVAPGTTSALTFRLPDAERPRLLAVTRAIEASSEADGGYLDDAVSPFALLDDAPFWLNSPKLVASGVPSVALVGDAPSLASAYDWALGGGGGLSARTRDVVSQLRSAGTDLVLGGHTRFGLMFQKSHPALDFGTSAAFGHDGAGGSLGFADPGTAIAFGYVTTSVPSPNRADPRALRVARAVRSLQLGSL